MGHDGCRGDVNNAAFELRFRDSSIQAVARDKKALIRGHRWPVGALAKWAGPGKTALDLSEHIKRRLGVPATQLTFDLFLDIALIRQVLKGS
jgi:hypothetical protein